MTWLGLFNCRDYVEVFDRVLCIRRDGTSIIAVLGKYNDVSMNGRECLGV